MTSQPTITDVFPPELTQALSERLRTQLKSRAGIDISPVELMWLHHEARVSNRERLSPPDVSGQSYKAVDDLRKSAKRFRDALASVKDRPPAIDERDLACELINDDWTAEDDIDAQVDISVLTTEELVDRMIEDIDLLRNRVESALNTASVKGRGKGRKTYGYDRFVKACQTVWKRHEPRQGWSTKEGRGSGRFVTFVYVVQDLLPPPMRKVSEGAVGDAVIATLKETN